MSVLNGVGRKKLVARGFLALGAVVILATLLFDGVLTYPINLLFNANLHEVVPGRFYRSGQMSGEGIVEARARYGIRSVINLRLGEEPIAEDGRNEKEVLEGMGIEYKHIPLNSTQLPDERSMEELLNAYDNLPEPILVHCTSGTHRTGVAAFIWLVVEGKETVEHAREQLTLAYGFFWPERLVKMWRKHRKTLDMIVWDYIEAQRDRSDLDMRLWINDYLRKEMTGADNS